MTRRIPHCHTCWKPVKGHWADAPCLPAQLDMFSGSDGGYVLTLAETLVKPDRQPMLFSQPQDIGLACGPIVTVTIQPSWLDIHRAQYAADPRREPDCGGCDYFGLCAAHSILAVDDVEGRARSKRKEPRAIEEDDGDTATEH